MKIGEESIFPRPLFPFLWTCANSLLYTKQIRAFTTWVNEENSKNIIVCD